MRARTALFASILVACGDPASPIDGGTSPADAARPDAARADAGPPPTGTALADLAATLPEGAWAELVTNDIETALRDTGASGNIIPYSDSAAWDPTSRQLLYIGADHITAGRFVAYSEATNSWRIMPDDPWIPDSFIHGYDHNVVRASTGDFFHRPFNSTSVYRYAIAAGTWTELPDPMSDSNNCCDGLAHFPELGGLVWAHGSELWLFGDETETWSPLPSVDMNGTWNFAEYNPVHHVVVLGNGSGRMHALSSTGEVTALRDPPISLYDGSGYTAAFTVDPVSGAYLVLTPTAHDLYAYDVVSDMWSAVDSPTQPDLSEHDVISTPIAAYGVAMFVECRISDCHVYLYRHRP